MTKIDEGQLHAILPQVSVPAQYVGREWNARCGDPDAAEVTFALLFPDTYEIGMSNVGLSVLYQVLNDLDYAIADRAYAPTIDMEEAMRTRGMPLFSIEHRRPLAEFDVVGISLQNEACYTNVLNLLDLAGIPLRSAERGDDHPLVVGGGPGAFAPETMAAFFDCFVVGDGEEAVVRLAETVRELKRSGAAREAALREIAALPFAYVPSLYEPTYDNGRFAGFAAAEGAPDLPIAAAIVEDLDAVPAPVRPIVPYVSTVHDRINIEIMRGCPRGCRFCQARATKRPLRTRSITQILETSERAYLATGHEEISLLSLSSSDYPEFERLLRTLTRMFRDRGVSVSLPSLRSTDQLTWIPAVLGSVRKSGLTLAPEAATERLRAVIGKRLSDTDIYEGAAEAYRQGWSSMKLYFMVGLPTEEDADIDAIAESVLRVSDARPAATGKKGPGRVNVTISPFVPKPHTLFEREEMAPPERLDEIRERLLGHVRRRSISLKFHPPFRSMLEGALCRGSRRMGDLVEAAWRAGARFDAWDEHLDEDAWRAAAEETGIDIKAEACRPRDEDEPLPWSCVSPCP